MTVEIKQSPFVYENNPTLNPVLLPIFSCVDLSTLGTIRQVCQQWKKTADSPNLEKNIIYNTVAFNCQKWRNYGGDEIKSCDNEESELKSLPDNMSEIFKNYFPGKKMKDCLLVRIPNGTSLLTLKRIMQKFLQKKGSFSEAFHHFISPVDNATGKSYWILMSKQVLDVTRGKHFKQQVELANNLGYDAPPKAVEAVACIFSEFLSTGNRLFNSDSIRCEERAKLKHTSGQVCVG